MKSNYKKLFEHTIHLTNDWIQMVDEETDFENPNRSFRLLRSTLHALRDILPVTESAQFSAQLPLLLKGIYYENWSPSSVPIAERSKDAFVARVSLDFVDDPLEDPEAAIASVFYVINLRVSMGEAESVRRHVQKSLRDLWLSPDLL